MTLKKAMARRDVLRMGTLGATAAWAATRANLGLAAGKVPIGVQLYSVRKDCEKDLPGTLKAVKGFGYDAVEFAGYYGGAPPTCGSSSTTTASSAVAPTPASTPSRATPSRRRSSTTRRSATRS